MVEIATAQPFDGVDVDIPLQDWVSNRGGRQAFWINYDAMRQGLARLGRHPVRVAFLRDTVSAGSSKLSRVAHE